MVSSAHYLFTMAIVTIILLQKVCQISDPKSQRFGCAVLYHHHHQCGRVRRGRKTHQGNLIKDVTATEEEERTREVGLTGRKVD